MRYRHAASLVAALLCAAASCASSENAVVRIDYTVSEFPSSGKVAWSCLAEGHTDGDGATAIDWTVGTPLVATPSPQFERTCGGLMGAPCPDPQIVTAPLAAEVWTLSTGPSPGAFFGGNARYLKAVAAGLGGMAVQAQGRAFPPLQLRAVAPSGFRFFQTDAAGTSLALVGRLVLAKGARVIIVPQLVAAEAHLCGFPVMTVTATGPRVVPDPTWNPDGRANAPLAVTGDESGKIHVSAAGADGTLFVDTN